MTYKSHSKNTGGASVRKVELLPLADEKYSIRAERLPDVLDQDADKKVEVLTKLPVNVQHLVGRTEP